MTVHTHTGAQGITRCHKSRPRGEKGKACLPAARADQQFCAILASAATAHLKVQNESFAADLHVAYGSCPAPEIDLT